MFVCSFSLIWWFGDCFVGATIEPVFMTTIRHFLVCLPIIAVAGLFYRLSLIETQDMSVSVTQNNINIQHKNNSLTFFVLFCLQNATRFICDFEVFGKVQGVFFRKYTREKARSLSLTGWCENTPSGTVRGSMEGSKESIMTMQTWLQTEGSPSSTISHAEFSSHLRPVTVYTSETFEIRKHK